MDASGGVSRPGVRVAERIGFTLYVLAAAFLIARAYASPPILPSTAASSASATATPTSTPLSTAVSSSAAVSATVAPTPAPQPTPVITAYRSGGRSFAALAVAPGYTLASPLSGTVSVVVYQLLGGEIRVGSNVPSEPFFPYITITSAETRLVLRPGALTRDVRLLVTDGQKVAVGSPLFTVIGPGASSWQTFYDRGVTAQVIASLASVPAGIELDAVALFTR